MHTDPVEVPAGHLCSGHGCYNARTDPVILSEDTEGYKMELSFIRDTDRREVDFVVMRDKRPEFFQVHMGSRDYLSKGTRVLPFHTFCAELELP